MAEDLATTLFLEFVGMPPPLIFAPLTGNLLLYSLSPPPLLPVSSSNFSPQFP